MIKNAPLIFITGPWASGKSTLTIHLSTMLPTYIVFDWDLLIPPLSQVAQRDVHTAPDTWPGLRATWSTLLRTLRQTGHPVVLVGPMTPADFQPGELGAGTNFCGYLDWPDAIIEERLLARGCNPQEIHEELAYLQTLRASKHTRLDARNDKPDELARRIQRWVTALGAEH